MSLTRRTLFLLLSLVCACPRDLTNVSAQDNPSCVDLAPYANDESKLAAFLAGGDLESPVPVYFDMPAVAGTTYFCLDHIPIPDSVDGVNCSDPTLDNCFLATGLRNDLERNDCTCSGTSFAAGDYSRDALRNSCGFGNNRWGMSCPDVMNGRRSIVNDTLVLSDSAVFRVAVCPERADRCNECFGESKPFQVGIMWITNVQTQCLGDTPFRSGAVNLVGASLGLVLIVLLL